MDVLIMHMERATLAAVRERRLGVARRTHEWSNRDRNVIDLFKLPW
jgi:hypothetical protein